jgi:thioredoxin 2
MKCLSSLLVALLLLGVTATAETIGELEFGDDFDALAARAQQSGTPILIDFYTDWCHWCKALADSTLPDAYVQKFLQNFELGKINAEADTLLAARYGVRSFPTVLLVKPTGIEIDRIVGFLPPEDFVSAVVASLAGVGTLEDLLTRLAQQPTNYDLTYKVAEKYMYRGDYNKARAYFAQILAKVPADQRALAATTAYRLSYMKYKEKDYEEAADHYAKVAVDYPETEEALDAQLMVAYSYQKAEMHRKARNHYKNFLKDYPETEEREWIEEQLGKMK